MGILFRQLKVPSISLIRLSGIFNQIAGNDQGTTFSEFQTVIENLKDPHFACCSQ